MFWLSEQLEPSVPMPTLMPHSSMRRMSARPLPRRMLLPGLCATDAPFAPSNCMSASSSQTPWATVKSGPTRPSASMCAVSVPPYVRRPAITCTFDSDTCECSGRPCSRARSRQPIRNSSLQWCGMVGAIARRTRSRSMRQPRTMASIACRVACAGARRRRSTSFCKAAGSDASSPGIASKKLRSATIGASTARMPACS